MLLRGIFCHINGDRLSSQHSSASKVCLHAIMYKDVVVGRRLRNVRVISTLSWAYSCKKQGLENTFFGQTIKSGGIKLPYEEKEANRLVLFL